MRSDFKILIGSALWTAVAWGVSWVIVFKTGFQLLNFSQNQLFIIGILIIAVIGMCVTGFCGGFAGVESRQRLGRMPNKP